MTSEQGLQLALEAKLSLLTGALRPYRYVQSIAHTSAETVRQVLVETRQLHAQLVPLAERAQEQQRATPDPSEAGSQSTDPALAAQLVSCHLQAYRNKRCLLVYHKQRTDWLKARVWDKAGALPLVLDEEQPRGTAGEVEITSIRPLLDHTELEWLRAYTGLVGLYKGTLLDILDVTLPLSTVPGKGKHDGHIVSNKPNASQARNALGSSGFGAPSAAVSVYAAQIPPNAIRAPDDLMVTVLVTRDARDVETERGTLQLRAGERLYVRRDEIEPLLLRGWLRVVDA
ncbi:DNA replication protein psf1 [Malassezia vespertilionis]|uniref:DNA replication complex GINS protein PSF1 n=1 Tax=Malassezia vespertilionis TaxID=2020962 RepID=A0A2N1JDX9_9BASI|nr:DNA replication protein psf1 [Malassezia vespertilionis]PKI84744.1 Psf1p [Malassezia vespertilionis]WFD05895.1 DNA replication protein psf1 [Malassezia vespertilionis]